MVYKGCTFGMEHGPCYVTPSVAIWTNKVTKRKTWTCAQHDSAIDKRLRGHGARSQYRRTPIKEPVSA